MAFSQIATSGTIAAAGTVVITHTLGATPSWVGLTVLDYAGATRTPELVASDSTTITVKNESAVGVLDNVNCLMQVLHSIVS